MKSGLLCLFIFLLGFHPDLRAESNSSIELDSAFLLAAAQQYIDETPELSTVPGSDRLNNFQQSKLALKYHKAFQENRRLTAAMLTFALGMLGVHRLYLGTKPWIPAVYLFTFGGGFLILPLIDLGVILFCKDLSRFENNDKVLMWVK